MVSERSQGESRHDSDSEGLPLRNCATDRSVYVGRRVEMP